MDADRPVAADATFKNSRRLVMIAYLPISLICVTAI